MNDFDPLVDALETALTAYHQAYCDEVVAPRRTGWQDDTGALLLTLACEQGHVLHLCAPSMIRPALSVAGWDYDYLAERKRVDAMIDYLARGSA